MSGPACYVADLEVEIDGDVMDAVDVVPASGGSAEVVQGP